MNKLIGILSGAVVLIILGIVIGIYIGSDDERDPEEETAAPYRASELADKEATPAYTSSTAKQAADEQSQPAAASGACFSHEQEVEPGICSYKVECSTPAECVIWGDELVRDLEDWYGDLTYQQEWDSDEEAGEEEVVIKTYPVKGNTIRINADDESEQYYKSLWDRFTWIIPSDQREMVTQFSVFEESDLMAYVVQNEDDYEEWTYAVHIEQPYYETERVLTDLHEFGHLLSLSSEQVDPYADEDRCGTYYLDEGCALRGSYIYEFYQKFWEDGDVTDEDNFVSEYAMTSDYEDFAESWAHFVVTPRPKGNSVAEQKISFFYDYDELVMLRAELLGRMASWLERYEQE